MFVLVVHCYKLYTIVSDNIAMSKTVFVLYLCLCTI